MYERAIKSAAAASGLDIPLSRAAVFPKALYRKTPDTLSVARQM
tara:strand:+ start:11025 stop:11156 length:132 start_codon:yes stop_codon:yes gene_type:complete